MIPAGELRHIVSIQAKTETTDAYGGSAYTWADVATGIRARKRPVRGREIVASGALQAEDTIVFSIRYIAGLTITSNMRLVEGNDHYEIVTVADVQGMARQLDITTKYGASDG